MIKNILVFIPNTLKRNQTGYLKGCYRKFEDCEAFYITDEVLSNNCKQCIGYIGKSFRNSKCRENNCLFLNNSNSNYKILINNDDYGGHSTTDIIYDYHGFKNSEIICKECDTYGKHFKIIAEELRKSNLNSHKDNGKKTCLGSISLIMIFILDVILKVSEKFIMSGNVNFMFAAYQYSKTSVTIFSYVFTL